MTKRPVLRAYSPVSRAAAPQKERIRHENALVSLDAVHRAAGRFPRSKHHSVWVDIHSSLFDPKRAHLMYNDFMDEMEFAADCGFDAVCCNEHHSNGYGLMPSPNLIASALSRRTRDTAICVMGNSLALYNPPTRVAEEFAMIDVISGGRLIAGFPVGTPMDTCYAYAQNPVTAARALSGSARSGDEGVAGAGHICLQRPL